MDKKLYIHIHIPKTAGCFVRELRAPKVFYPELENVNAGLKYHFTVKFLKKYLPAACDEKVGIFAIVRNPYDRVYSLWKWLSRDVRDGGGGVFGEIYQPLITDDFETFVRDLCSDYYLGYYGVQSQLYYIKGHEDLNFEFFKLEETEKLKDFLVDSCGATWSDKKVNESPGQDYRTVYTPELADLVKNYFAEEFEFFGYPVDLAAPPVN
jgi:hypothetical protein